MKKLRKILAILVAACLVFGMMPTALAAQSAQTVAEQLQKSGSWSVDALSKALRDNMPENATQGSVSVEKGDYLDDSLKKIHDIVNWNYQQLDEPDADTIVRVIVVLEEKSLLERDFTTAQIATNSVTSAAVQTIERKQTDTLQQLRVLTGNTALEPSYRYNVVMSGFSVDIPYGSLEAVRQLEGVRSAYVAPTYSVPEDMSSDTLSTNLSSATGLAGAVKTWETLGYRGEGMRIAILDTGLDVDHPSFADAPTLTSDSLYKTELESVLKSLNAYQMYGDKLSADDLYHSDKVPFGFNYADANTDVGHDNDDQGDHGTHVAGIAAANDIDSTDVVGMAPEAQLIAMKVFGQNVNGATFDVIVAALEDAFRLNADAVNLSLGSPAGFSSEYEEVDAVFAQVLKSDMILAISSGNEASFSYGNAMGTDKNFTYDPDIGLMGSPGAYIGATTVGSMENDYIRVNYVQVGERKLGYNDSGDVYALLDYAGKSFEYVMIPNYGAEEDYEDLDVSGKIAVVSRGGTPNFLEKQENAYNAGAAMCIVYDNVDGELIYMQNANLLPCAFISKADGEAMAAAATDGIGTLTIAAEDDLIPVNSGLSGTMSTFSSVGVTPDLKLEPDITSYGGNIYSTLNNGTYGTMSGTSMSTPAITGMSALVLQYLRDKYDDLSDEQKHTVAEALLMSTATALVDPDNTEIYYSPRLQGAGNANVYHALTTPAYLTVGGSTPKMSLGDDDNRSGIYTFTFEIHNMSERELVYDLGGVVMTDQYTVIDDVEYMGETGRKLDAAMRFSVIDEKLVSAYDLDGDKVLGMADVTLMLKMLSGNREKTERLQQLDLNGDGKVDTADAQTLFTLLCSKDSEMTSVTVGAGETVTVGVTIELTQEDKDYIDAHYEMGMYVDGFVTLNAASEDAVELSLPYLGFYGDWSEARIFDSGYWFESDEELEYMRYPHVLFTQYNYDDYGYNLGLNPYLEEEYDTYHNVISPNGDGYNDYLGDIYLGMMRNAKRLDIIWDTYDENGEKVSSVTQTAEYVRKSYYYSYFSMCVPFTYYSYFDDLTEITNGLPDGYRVEMTVEAYLDDGDDIMDERLSFPVDGGITALPIYIDSTAPTIVNEDINYWYDEASDTRRLDFYVQDNHAIAAVVTTTLAGDIIDVIAVEDSTEPQFISIDVSDYDSEFYLCVCDYGANEAEYKISFHGENDVDFGSFYGYRYSSTIVDTTYDYSYETDSYNGWYSFESADDQLRHTNEAELGEAKVTAAEYIDGYILGVDDEGGIFAIESGTWTRTKLGTLQIDGALCTAMDMAFDHVHKALYLVAYDGEYSYYLVRMNYRTGEYQVLGTVYDDNVMDDYDFNHSVTLACDNDGVLYSIDAYSGCLFTIDPATCKATFVASTGYYPQGERQSMTVDHETNELYWAANDGEWGGVGNFLYRVDKATGELTEICRIESKGVMTGLYKPYRSGEELYPADAEVYGLQLSREKVLLGEGLSSELICKQLPFYADPVDVTWESSDESVVVVHNGMLLAVGEGKATVRVYAGEMYDSCEVEVFRFSDELYAFDTGVTVQWLRFPAGNATQAEYLENTTYAGKYFSAAAYHDGYVYACSYDGNIFRLDPETMQGVKLRSIGNPLMGMAFNYVDGFMYGVQMQIDSYGNQTSSLVRVNLMSGKVQYVMTLDEYSFGTILCSLAIDSDGYFYFISRNSASYQTELLKCYLDPEYDYLEVVQTAQLGDYAVNGYGALHYSLSNGGLYWTNDDGKLFWTHPSTIPQVQVVDLGTIGSVATTFPQFLALFCVPENEPSAPVAEPEWVELPDSYLIPQGATVDADLSVEPWNALVEARYEITDSSVATVDSFGSITAVGIGETTLTVTVDAMDLTLTASVRVIDAAGELYGYLLDDAGDSDQWIHLSDTAPDVTVTDASGDSDMSLLAGTYYDGYIYGIAMDLGNNYGQRYFVRVDIANGYRMKALSEINVSIRDMTFDYTTGVLYGIAEGGKYTGALVQFDLQTGKMSAVAETGRRLAALTVDYAGTMYAIDHYGCLYTLDKLSGKTSYLATLCAFAGSAQQSMTYSAKNGMLYWAQLDSEGTSSLCVIDPQSGASAQIGSAAQIAALYCLPETEPAVPETVAPNGVLLASSLFMITGSEKVLDAVVLPVSVAHVDRTLTWESSDESVVTVDENGVATAVAAGKATVTVRNAAGNSASCEITVSDTERVFYAYDRSNCRWISFLAGSTCDVGIVRTDSATDAPIEAAAYTGERIYAYDENGYFYSIDPETFERNYIGEGVSEQQIAVERYDWDGNMTAGFDTVRIQDLAWDEQSGKLYAAAILYDENGWEDQAYLVEIDTQTGKVEKLLLDTTYNMAANLMICGGKAYFIDCYYYALMSADLSAAEPEMQYVASLDAMWNTTDASVGFVVDTVTGHAYIVRDLTETWSDHWDGVSGQAMLYIIDLETGAMEPTTEDGLYISDGILLRGLLVK